jgi:hypothetical protein
MVVAAEEVAVAALLVALPLPVALTLQRQWCQS